MTNPSAARAKSHKASIAPKPESTCNSKPSLQSHSRDRFPQHALQPSPAVAPAESISTSPCVATPISSYPAPCVSVSPPTISPASSLAPRPLFPPQFQTIVYKVSYGMVFELMSSLPLEVSVLGRALHILRRATTALTHEAATDLGFAPGAPVTAAAHALAAACVLLAVKLDISQVRRPKMTLGGATYDLTDHLLVDMLCRRLQMGPTPSLTAPAIKREAVIAAEATVLNITEFSISGVTPLDFLPDVMSTRVGTDPAANQLAQVLVTVLGFYNAACEPSPEQAKLIAEGAADVAAGGALPEWLSEPMHDLIENPCYNQIVMESPFLRQMAASVYVRLGLRPNTANMTY